MKGRYILRGHEPVRCHNRFLWAQCGSTTPPVGETLYGRVYVITVFLGWDHRVGRGLPLLFKTDVFGGKHGGFHELHSTWEEADAGHARAVTMVKEEGQ